MQLVRAAAAAARLQWIGGSFRGGVKRLSGSAGLCICRPCSACYFLEVIRPTLPHQGKALMISGSHEICTACRSRLPRFTEPRFAFSFPPFLLSTVPSYYLFLSPPFIIKFPPSPSISSVFLFFSHLPRNLPVCHPPSLFLLTCFSSLSTTACQNVHNEHDINTTKIP